MRRGGGVNASKQMSLFVSEITMGKYFVQLICKMSKNAIALSFEICEDAIFFFFNVGTPGRVHLFDHILWSIFPSSITYYIFTISLSSCMFHGDLLWATLY